MACVMVGLKTVKDEIMSNHLFKPGQSGNPAGRPKLPPEVKEAMKVNGGKGVERMRQLLDDDTAWGPKGWMDAKTQVKAAETAIKIGYGQQPAVEDGPELNAKDFGSVLRQVYEGLKEEGGMAEFIHARKANEHEGMKDVTPKDDEDAA